MRHGPYETVNHGLGFFARNRAVGTPWRCRRRPLPAQVATLPWKSCHASQGLCLGICGLCMGYTAILVQQQGRFAYPFRYVLLAGGTSLTDGTSDEI